jgi:hypothetical protein
MSPVSFEFPKGARGLITDPGRPPNAPPMDVTQEELGAFVQQRLTEYQLSVRGVHVHRCASITAHDLRITLDRSVHMASLTAVESFLAVAVRRRFGTELRSVFWRYRPRHGTKT